MLLLLPFPKTMKSIYASRLITQSKERERLSRTLLLVVSWFDKRTVRSLALDFIPGKFVGM